MTGVLARFRAPSLRAVDHRWRTADCIVTDSYGRHLLDSTQSKRAVWHDDAHVRALIRLMALTNRLSWMPDKQDIRPGDEFYVTAINLMRGDRAERYRHTIECLLLGDAPDEAIAEYLDIDPRIIGLAHDIFFDVRDRLRKPLLIQDLLFPPGVMQGGVKDVMGVERVIAYLTGHQLFYCFRIGYYEDDQIRQAFQKLQDGLMKNQGISALLRRSLGFESTECVIEHMQQHLLISAREAARDVGSEDTRIGRVKDGVQSLLSQNLKPEVVREGDKTFASMAKESATAAADRVQEGLQ